MEFAAKPEPARQMIHTALARVPGGWVAGDEVYGRNPGLRSYLEQQRVGYVMEMAATDRMDTPRGPLAVKELAVLVPAQAWQKRSVGAGSKGERFYDWALADDHTDAAGVRWVLMRRNRTSGDLAFFRCYAPRAVFLSRLVAVAGHRWRVEESFAPGQEPGRVGRVPGAHVEALAPVESDGDGGLCIPGPVPAAGTAPPSAPVGSGGAVVQRDLKLLRFGRHL